MLLAIHENNNGDGSLERSESLSISDEDDDHSFSTDDVHGSLATHEDDDRDGLKSAKKMAERETAYVNALRILVFLMFIVGASSVTVLTYIVLHREDVEDFETSFKLFAASVEDSVEFYLQGVVDAMEGFSDSFTTHAHSSGSEWPLVTVPNLEVHAKRARNQAKIEMLLFSPLVHAHQMEAWNEYSIGNQGWIEESFDILGKERTRKESIPPFVYFRDDNGQLVPSTGGGPYPAAPIWQMSPPPNNPGLINYDSLVLDSIQDVYTSFETEPTLVLRPASTSEFIGSAFTQQEHDAYHSNFMRKDEEPGFADEHPHSTVFYPVFEQFNDKTSDIVGIVRAILPWDKYLEGLLPNGVNGIYAVLRNDCNQSFTYVVNGNNAEYLGEGDLHRTAYNHLEYVIDLAPVLGQGNQTTLGHSGCRYSFSLYPTDRLSNSYESANPITIALVVAATTMLMGIAFLAYDFFIQRKNKQIIGAAAVSNAIVSSLFPSNVRDRLFKQGENSNRGGGGGDYDLTRIGKHGLKSFLAGGIDNFSGETDDDGFKTKPIADLFPDTTILFCDLVGFTAWSSVREPSQVFTLLETVYHAFDQIAKARRVFKVETVGDCYVAVTGLPDPRKDHAVAMARFAHDCLRKVHALTKKLEVTLGPDTGDLSVRVGLHSGPVTAGVLRGERSRFQLFGDTMNTASRMESTGQKGRIQLSQETADLLISAGKSHWLTLREDKILAKGKGELQTYWLDISSGQSSSVSSSGNEADETPSEAASTSDMDDNYRESVRNLMTGKVARLIDWNAEVLGRLLKQIIASRDVPGRRVPREVNTRRSFASSAVDPLVRTREGNGTVLDEVREIIVLPEFNAGSANNHGNFESLELPEAVNTQLHDYVRNIAALYRDNPFHNFEHASHVTMSVVKLLSRIVAPTDIEYELDSKKKVASILHDHTYGITSDPLTQFACALSALIHDVDHMGVPNTQLVQENPQLAATYKNKSVAEQNSVDLAWDLLMDDNFQDLRAAIYSTPDEMQRFRQLVVNSVMATDIMDKDLKALRNARWDKAFMEGSPETVALARENVNRKATIVIEHLIQASDVAHTMQHWHIYRKWNERLFREMTLAYKQGRAKTDPAENWYKGELGFFDFYIIPLAKKLKECGVFGVSSAEYLNYAEKNREEWEERGQQVVAEMLESLEAEGGEPKTS